MVENPYPIPRQLRQSDILVGDGGDTYGPFGFRIFDPADVVVCVRPAGALRFVEALGVVVTKINGNTALNPLDDFRIKFPALLPNTTRYVVLSSRIAARAAGVMSGTRINPDALEKEFSKIATEQQELRRDINRAIMTDFGAPSFTLDADIPDGRTLMKQGDRLTVGPDIVAEANRAERAADIAAGYANDAISGGMDPGLSTVLGMGAIKIPAGINHFNVAGYYSAGDGLGNIYVKDAGENGFRETVTDANGEIFYEAGDILRPVTISIPGDFANLNELFDYLNLRRIRAKVTVNVTAGVIDHPGLLVISHPDAKNVEVFGDFSSHTISSVGVASGTAYAWDVPFTLDDVTGVDVGQFVQIEAKATNGAGDGSNIEGTWRIVSVAGNIITVRITSQAAAFPGVTDVNIGCRILKSVLRWDSAASSGIYIAGTAAGYFGNIVLDGQYDVATGIGSDTAGNGLFVGGFSHIILGLAGDQMPTAASVTFRRCAFVRWKADGALVHGNAQADLAFSHGCANGWRGIQSGGGGSSIFAKSCVGSGNRKSGIECEAAGSLNINNSVAAGNGEPGIYSPFDGGIMGTNCRSLLNAGAGVDLRRLSVGEMSGTISKNNTTNGFYADRNSTCCVDGVICSGNPDGDLRVQYNGRMSATVAPTLASATPYRTTSTSPGFFDIPGVSGQITNGLFVNSPSGAMGGGVISPVSSGAMLFQLRSAAAATAVSTYEMTSLALRPVNDNTVSLGDGSHRLTSIFAASGTINTSDERSKSDIGAIPDAWLDAWGEVEWCRFKFRDAIDIKGDGARWHIGLIAQQVRDVFAERGIDAFEIGLLCYDEWEASDGEVDDDGNVIRPAIDAGNRYGLRYEECFAVEAAYQRRRLARVETLLEVNQASDLS